MGDQREVTIVQAITEAMNMSLETEPYYFSGNSAKEPRAAKERKTMITEAMKERWPEIATIVTFKICVPKQIKGHTELDPNFISWALDETIDGSSFEVQCLDIEKIGGKRCAYDSHSKTLFIEVSDGQ